MGTRVLDIPDWPRRTQLPVWAPGQTGSHAPTVTTTDIFICLPSNEQTGFIKLHTVQLQILTEANTVIKAK